MSLLTFAPLYQHRLWGGQTLATAFQRQIPPDALIGESWELVDRPEACSRITSGKVAGAETLHDLWQLHRARVFGSLAPASARFPILVKLLDCVETLSVQVHPPEASAEELGGEPKTEMWLFLQTRPDALIYAGLKPGVTREQFQQHLGKSGIENLLHILPTSPGEAMFLPSGRVHAIGAGNLILEVQQNSDTTYRVDDWGRVDPKTGQPRELHVESALRSIDFNDHAPTFVQPHGDCVLACRYFTLKRHYLLPGEYQTYAPAGTTFHYHFITSGTVRLGEQEWSRGSAWMMTADSEPYDLNACGTEPAEVLTVTFGQ